MTTITSAMLQEVIGRIKEMPNPYKTKPHYAFRREGEQFKAVYDKALDDVIKLLVKMNKEMK